MYGCELIWGAAEARRVRELMEEAIGGPCACARNERCVLPLPAAGEAEPLSGSVEGLARKVS